MNLFQGQLKELENVLVDNFILYESNTCFFLSHCHTDHMHGLNQLLLNLDTKPNHYLYCSPISRLILLNKFENCNENVIRELRSSEVIRVPEKGTSPSYQVTVTPISAGHCPGSIMFLFEAINKTILYTGDFRIVKNDVRSFKQLHCKTQVKSIDTVYLDSTFLNVNYWNFPHRSEIITDLVSIIKKWISNGHQYNVFLQTSANYGYEFVFVELARKLKCKIHVKKAVYDLFWNIPDIGCYLSKDCSCTNIHAFCMSDKKCSPCYDVNHLLTIKLSAQWYKSPEGAKKEVIQKDAKGKNIVVCYSTHSSCSELVDFLSYLKPKRVKPCTIAVGSTEEDMKAYLREIISSWSTEIENGRSEPGEEKLLLERNYKFKLKFPNCEPDLFEDFEESSPERKKRFVSNGKE